MTFRVGQKVVCVDSFGPSSSGSSAPWDDGEALINGEIYTIASIHRDNYGVPVVWLIEIARTKNARAFHGPLCGYGPHRFRPLIDISDLAAIVTEVMKNRTRTITPDKFDHARTKVGQ